MKEQVFKEASEIGSTKRTNKNEIQTSKWNQNNKMKVNIKKKSGKYNCIT